MTSIFCHLLAAFLVLAAPWLGHLGYQRARRKIAAGLPNAKVQLYRGLVIEQVVAVGVVFAIWRLGAIPVAKLGLVVPAHWAWNLTALVIIVALLVRSGLKLRSKAGKIRNRLAGGMGAVLPESHQERVWFGTVSVGAGIAEELLFRGFLFYYLAVYVPQMNTLEKVLLVSLTFGFAHIYQGWKGALGVGIVGLGMAVLYVMTGSLLMPVVLHAAIDLRILMIFPPEESPAIVQEVGA